MDDPTLWAIIWLAAAASFGIGEIVAAGSFFLAPFAISALVASVVSLFEAPLLVSWAVFIVVAFLAYLFIRPLAKKLDLELPEVPGIGANRLVGSAGTVIQAIPFGVASSGMVKIGGEEWRAEGRDGQDVAAGTQVKIIEIKGTRVVVEPDIRPL